MELNWGREHSEIMWITPQMAAAWLMRNTRNRDQREKVLSGYVRDHIAGNFQFNGESIQFDRDGILINGQHRLEMIVETGKPLKAVVVTGLDPAVRATIDIGSSRTVPDAFKFANMANMLGVNVGKNTAAGMWARMKYGLTATKGKETRQELLAFARHYTGGGEFALCEFGKHKRVRAVVVAPVMAAVARAWYHFADKPKLAWFVEVLCSGMQRHPDDRTIIVLRESLLGGKGKNSNAQPEIYGKTARAIQAYMRGDDLKKIYCPHDDPFPLPDKPDPSSDPGSSGMAGNTGQLFGRGPGVAGVAEAAH